MRQLKETMRGLFFILFTERYMKKKSEGKEGNDFKKGIIIAACVFREMWRILIIFGTSCRRGITRTRCTINTIGYGGR